MDNELRIERQIYISAPAEKVWDAIVTPELASRYFVVPLLQCDRKVGGRIIYGTPEENVMNCEVLEYEPGKRLVHMFGYDPDEPLSRVTYEVEAIGDMCRLTLTHDRFASGSRTYEEVNRGWPGILVNLKLFLETGEVPEPSGGH